MVTKIGTKEVELSVLERYTLARMQPQKGNFIELTMSKNLITLLELQPAEAEAWGYVEQSKGRWIPKLIEGEAATLSEPIDDRMAVITMSETHFSRIAEQLEAASKGGTLEMVHYHLYELFVRQPERDAENDAVRGIHAVEAGG